MDFWDVFVLLLIYIPLLILWAVSILDIFSRRDLSGVSKALWLVVVVVFPFLGTLVYVVVHPPALLLRPERTPGFQREAASDDMMTVEDLHARGVLDDSAYSAAKARFVE